MSKPAGKQKPKPPPYPRPVPQFVVEEIPPTPSDIAWDLLNGGGYYSKNENQVHDEVETERRAAKRRRIEICATAYLRGESLMLMSAQLKGPINEGWKNPWGKRRNLGQREQRSNLTSVEIPETATKKIPSIDDAGAAKAPKPVTYVRAISGQSPCGDVGMTSPTRDVAPSPFTARIIGVPNEISPKVPKKAKEKRVKEWLRTSETLPQPGDILVQSSPTPSNTRRKTPGQLQQHAFKPRASQSEPPRMVSPIDGLSCTVVSVPDLGVHRISQAERRVQQLSKDMQNMIAEPALQPSHDLQEEVWRLTHPSSSSKGLLNSSRAEYAILRAKQNMIQTAPADAHLSPFEFRKVTISGDTGGKGGATATTELTSEPEDTRKTLGPGPGIAVTSENCIEVTAMGSAAQSIHTSSGRVVDEFFMTAPQLSTQPANQRETATKDSHIEDPVAILAAHHTVSNAISGTSMTDPLPSAQPRPELDVPFSNIARDERLLSIKNVSSCTDTPVLGEELDKDQDNHAETPVEALTADTSTRHQNPNEQNVGVTTPTPARVVAEMSTQEILANIEPLEMSTIKKPQHPHKPGTPSTMTKKADKKRKKTSFTFDHQSVSSYGSIKDVMKARVSKKLGSPPPFLLGKADLDLEVSDGENEVHHKRPRRMSSSGRPKGILKSTNPSSSPSSVRKSKRGYLTDQEQDGDQRVLPPGSGQNELDTDNFDLDAAIDDLGSFLGTWDAEKEASSIDIGA